MSRPPQGGNPPGEVHARKKGRKRRPASKRSGGSAQPLPGRSDLPAASGGVSAEQASRGEPATGNHGQGGKPAGAGNVRSGAGESSAPRTASESQQSQQPPYGKKRRRRRGKRRHAQGGGSDGADQNKTGPDTGRHIRSPVTPAAPAAFDENKARDASPASRGNSNGAGAPNQRPGSAERIDGNRNDGRGRFRQQGRGRYPNRRNGQGPYNRQPKQPAFAALDLGTNNCRLLVAVPQEYGRFKVIDAFSRIVRLGQGLSHTGRLGEEAMERAIGALSVCASKLAHHRIVSRRLIATEACRRAENGMHFLAEVKRRTGLELEVVDRETEARLAAEGCGTLMERSAHGAVLFDIGGGSSELILIDRNLAPGGQLSGQIAAWTSLPLGVVTLSEHHGGRHVTRTHYDAMVAEVLGHLDGFEGRDRLAGIWNNGKTHLLGTSGTVTTIAGVHLKLPRYDRRKVDGTWLSDTQIDKVIDDLLKMDYEQRALNPCIGRDRADLVLAGCAILQAIRMTWPSPRLRVADRGLREGILNQLMLTAGVWANAGPGRGAGAAGLPEDQHHDAIPRES